MIKRLNLTLSFNLDKIVLRLWQQDQLFENWPFWLIHFYASPTTPGPQTWEPAPSSQGTWPSSLVSSKSVKENIYILDKLQQNKYIYTCTEQKNWKKTPVAVLFNDIESNQEFPANVEFTTKVLLSQTSQPKKDFDELIYPSE